MSEPIWLGLMFSFISGMSTVVFLCAVYEREKKDAWVFLVNAALYAIGAVIIQ